jgi:glycolate oxidase iron-sulfur subunit
MSSTATSAEDLGVSAPQPVTIGIEPAHPVRDVVDYELLFDCVHCGLCLEACPTYIVTRAEMDSPRGRIYLMKALADGTLQLDDDAVRHLDLCLGCRGCETACPSGVHYGKLIEKARAYVEHNYRRSFGERFRNWIVGAIFPYPGRLRVMLAPLAIAERLGLRSLVQRLAPGSLREWVRLLPPLTRRKRPALMAMPVTPPAADALAAVVHHGCVAQVLTPSENGNTEALLAASGHRILQLDRTACCGALDLHNGNLERARELARINVRAITNSGAEAILSAASGCAAVIAAYGDLLKDDAELAGDARRVAERVRELSGMLLARQWVAPRRFDAVVTYHDSCHLAHGLGIRDNPRAILRAIPGVKLVELGESDLCCGSAGSYNLTEPEMAHELARRKADNIAATGAAYVVLGNPGCELQIAAELRQRGSSIRVMHLADFLALAKSGNPALSAGEASPTPFA